MAMPINTYLCPITFIIGHSTRLFSYACPPFYNFFVGIWLSVFRLVCSKAGLIIGLILAICPWNIFKSSFSSLLYNPVIFETDPLQATIHRGVIFLFSVEH